jgi:hypothetical protein
MGLVALPRETASSVRKYGGSQGSCSFSPAPWPGPLFSRKWGAWGAADIMSWEGHSSHFQKDTDAPNGFSLRQHMLCLSRENIVRGRRQKAGKLGARLRCGSCLGQKKLYLGCEGMGGGKEEGVFGKRASVVGTCRRQELALCRFWPKRPKEHLCFPPCNP